MTRYTELQISSELLDQPDFDGAPKKVFVCSTPRSGSYLLCRHMINAGLGVPHEYFNPIVMGQMAPRLGLEDDLYGLTWWPRGRRDRLLMRRRGEEAGQLAFLEKYLDFLLTRRCQGGVFAAKIHFRDFRRTLNNPLGQELLKDGLFIHLYREDLVKQAVSEHFSWMTGRWGIDDTVTTQPASNPDFFDPQAIDRSLFDLADQDRGWRAYLARKGVTPISISYETLCKEPFAFVETIARRLEIDPATLRRGYAEPASASESDPTLPSKSEAARRYLAAVPSLPDPFGWAPRLDIRRLFGGQARADARRD
ncbi:MAG TPA: Stf0 family sulfotransferase [Caulobacteraceae bacterium]|nr:Stf0 family sulfotransferase [Caulobacteraceae bacterium]